MTIEEAPPEDVLPGVGPVPEAGAARAMGKLIDFQGDNEPVLRLVGASEINQLARGHSFRAHLLQVQV